MAQRTVRGAWLAVAATVLSAGCARRVVDAPRGVQFVRVADDGARFAACGEGGWSAVVDEHGLAFAPAPQAAPVVLRTTAIGRGAVRTPVEPSRATLAGDGAVHVARARGVTEELRASARGVEQSWRFDARPTGAGDLVVRVAMPGAHADGRDAAGGLHLRGASPRGVSYGRATWVDARGARNDVAVRAVGDALELTVPADLVERASYPAVLDPPIMMDDVVLDPAWTNAQSTPTIAAGGTNFAVAWSTLSPGDTLDDIHGEGFTTAGGSILYAGTSDTIYALHLNQTVPAIAWTGTRYIVLWSDEGTGSVATPIGGSMIRGAVYTPGSSPTLTDEFSLCDSNGADLHPAIACDPVSHGCVAAWESDVVGGPVPTVRIIGFDSDLIGAVGLPVCAPATSPAMYAQRTPAVAYGSSEFVIVWSERDAPLQRIVGVGLNESGTTVAGLSVSSAGANVVPRVAYGSSGFYAVWESLSTTGSSIMGGPVGSTITERPAAPASATAQRKPDIAFNGANFIVAWSALQPDASLRTEWSRLSATGTVLDAAARSIVLPPTGNQTDVALASDGAGITAAAYTAQSQTWVALLDDATTTTCVDGATCPSGFVCSGGVCVTANADAGLPDAIGRTDVVMVPDVIVVDDAPQVGDGAGPTDGGPGPQPDARAGDGASAGGDGSTVPEPGTQFHGGACACTTTPGRARRSRGGPQAVGALALALALAARRRRA